MPRRRVAEKREVIPDPVYKNKVATKFMTCMMMGGKKSTTERIFYGTLDILGERTNEEPLKVFLKALENVKPTMEVRSRRVGGSTYQVPNEVRPSRRMALAFRWIIAFARKRSEKSMKERLATELLDAYRNKGTSIKKRDDTHKMAEANKAFAHYRW